jgi:hypothetical protein
MLLGFQPALYLSKEEAMKISDLVVSFDIAKNIFFQGLDPYWRLKQKGIQETPNAQNMAPPPSYVCSTCHKALTFLKEYNKWYCFNCHKYDE